MFQPISTLDRSEVIGATASDEDLERVLFSVHERGYFRGTLLVPATSRDDGKELQARYAPDVDLVHVVDPMLPRPRGATRIAMQVPADCEAAEDCLFNLLFARPEVLLIDVSALSRRPVAEQRRVADVLGLCGRETNAAVVGINVDTEDHLHLAMVLGAAAVQGLREGRPSTAVPTARRSLPAVGAEIGRPLTMAHARLAQLVRHAEDMAAARPAGMTVTSSLGERMEDDRRQEDGFAAVSNGWSFAVVVRDLGDSSSDAWPDSHRRYEVLTTARHSVATAIARDLLAQDEGLALTAA